jgi:hypothetical protein
MGKSGGGDPGGYGAAASNLYNMLASMGGEQWGITKPGLQNAVNMGQWQSGMARQTMPWLLQTYANRYTGGPNVRSVTGGLRNESPGAVPVGDVAASQPAGWGAAPQIPGGGAPVAPGASAAAPVTTPAAPVDPGYPVPDFNLPGTGQNVGQFDTSLYDLERGLWERTRTDIERQGAQGYSNLQQQLGQRFGISGASPSLAAGAGAQLQGAMNEDLINARLGITQGLQQQQSQNLQGLTGLISGLMGLDSSVVNYGTMNANNALGSAGQGLTGLAQWKAQQQASGLQGLAGLAAALGQWL